MYIIGVVLKAFGVNNICLHSLQIAMFMLIESESLPNKRFCNVTGVCQETARASSTLCT